MACPLLAGLLYLGCPLSDIPLHNHFIFRGVDNFFEVGG